MKKILSLLLLIFLTACIPLTETKETREVMGTIATITILGPDTHKADKAIDEAFEEIDRIESLMSIYQESQLSTLNEDGILENADPEIVELIKKSNHYSSISDGAFDISVQPILELYSESFEQKKRPPTEEEINKTLKLVDYASIEIEDTSIKFNKEGMKITLGAIAKGYAVDKAIEVLKDNEIKHSLVDLGGDMRAIGSKITEPWSIALENPRDKSEYISIIKLKDQAVATSGDYERYFNENRSFHHIVNPKTGYSATDLISVTIIAPTALEADSISTSAFVLGPKKGLELIGSLENVEGLLITKERNIIKSSGFD